MKSLEEALKEREDFLKENPHMQEYQDEIDEVLDKCVSDQDRLICISMMLAGKMSEQVKQMNTLSKILSERDGTDTM